PAALILPDSARRAHADVGRRRFDAFCHAGRARRPALARGDVVRIAEGAAGASSAGSVRGGRTFRQHVLSRDAATKGDTHSIASWRGLFTEKLADAAVRQCGTLPVTRRRGGRALVLGALAGG